MITILEDLAFAAIVLGCLAAFTRLAAGAGWAWAHRPASRARREYPPLNPPVPMPPDLGVFPASCGCELVWRPCVVHDPALWADMERRAQ